MTVKEFTKLGFRSCITKTSERISKEYSRYLTKNRGDYTIKIYTKRLESVNDITIELVTKNRDIQSFTLKSATMPKLSIAFKEAFGISIDNLPLYLKEYAQH